MKTLRDPHTPAPRVATGDAILESGKALDAADRKALGATFAKFVARHGAYAAAEAIVEKAEANVRAQQANIADAAHAVAEAVEAIATKLIDAGAKRTSPLKGYSKKTASEIAEASHANQKTFVAALTKAIRNQKGASKELLAACNVAEKATAALLKADAAAPPIERARHQAIVRRDTLGVPWEKAFKALKNKAKTVDDERGSSTFASLFDAETAHLAVTGSTKRSKKGAKQGGAPATPAAPAATSTKTIAKP